MKKYITSIAGINIVISGDDKISKFVAQDLNAKKYQEEQDYDLLLNINGNYLNKYVPSVFSAKGKMNFNENEYFVGYLNDVKYFVKNLFNIEPIEVYINANINKKRIRSIIRQICLMDNNNREKNIILSYSIFWYIFHIILLKKNKSFVHAGIYSNLNGEATVIIGTGGCGKTSTLFKLLEDEKTKYIAEDFGIVDVNSLTYFNPKPISIYSSDMEFGQKILQDYYYKFSMFDKLLWNIEKNILKNNPMVKAKPDKVMNIRIANVSKIKKVLYFLRNSDPKLCVCDISLEELCERALDASIRELKTLNELILLMRANAPVGYKIPSPADLRIKIKNIYKKSFKKTINKIVFIPYGTRPDELIVFLKKEGLV